MHRSIRRGLGDGTVDAGDCCSPSCQFEPNGTICGSNACAQGDSACASATATSRTSSSPGRWGATRCRTAAPSVWPAARANKSNKIALLPVPTAPTAIRFAAKIKLAGVVPPFRDPITVTMTYGDGIDRAGSITDCKAGNTTISCKEF